MTLQDLFETLQKLPGHEKLVNEDYRLTMDLYDPGNPSELHFYLTGPDTFYLFQTLIDQGDEMTLEEYMQNVPEAEDAEG